MTLSLPKATLRKVRLLAAERGSSISGLLVEALETLADEESGYQSARQRQEALLERGFDLGLTEGDGRA